MATSKKKTTKKASKKTAKKTTTAGSKKTGKKAGSKINRKTTSKKAAKKVAVTAPGKATRKKTSKKTTKRTTTAATSAAGEAPVRTPATKKAAGKKAAAPRVKTAADLDRVGRAGRSALPRKTSRPRGVSPALRARKEALAQRQARTGPVVRIQYYRSAIGLDMKQKSIVAGLGLRRLNAVRVLPDTPALRGMIAKVPHLVRVLPDADAPGA